jgi:hypothetical protein
MHFRRALTSMALIDIRLGDAFESVEAHFRDRDIHFRLVVPAETLRKHFGASEEPQSWLQVFNDNVDVIERAALRVFAATSRSPVILLNLSAAGKAR